MLGRVETHVRTQLHRLGKTAGILFQHDHARTAHLGDLRLEKAHRAGADDAERIAHVQLSLVHAVQRDGDRLDHGRLLEGDLIGDDHEVRLDDRGGNVDVLGKAAAHLDIFVIILFHALAEVVLAAFAVKAEMAACAVGRDDLLADQAGIHALADLCDDACILMARGERRRQEGIAALVDLYVSAAGQRRLDLNLYLTGLGIVDLAVDDLHVHGAVDHGHSVFLFHDPSILPCYKIQRA